VPAVGVVEAVGVSIALRAVAVRSLSWCLLLPCPFLDGVVPHRASSPLASKGRTPAATTWQRSTDTLQVLRCLLQRPRTTLAISHVAPLPSRARTDPAGGIPPPRRPRLAHADARSAEQSSVQSSPQPQRVRERGEDCEHATLRVASTTARSPAHDGASGRPTASVGHILAADFIADSRQGGSRRRPWVGHEMAAAKAKSASPIRVRLETLFAAVAIVAYRASPDGPIRHAISPPPPAVLRMLHDLGWLPDIRRLLAAGNDVTVPS
jgi:hypothetical protein